MKLTKEIRKIMLAYALGDGHIRLQGKYCSLRVAHSTKQSDYLEWKLSKIRSFCTSGSVLFENSGYAGIKFTSKSYKFLRLYNKTLYKDKEKVITPKHLKSVGDIGLAILYMDDGSLYVKKTTKGVPHAYEMVISLYFKKEQQVMDIIHFIKQTYGVIFTVKRNKGRFSIRCGTKEARKFIEIVKPFVSQVPSLRYKIEMSENLKVQALFNKQ